MIFVLLGFFLPRLAQAQRDAGSPGEAATAGAATIADTAAVVPVQKRRGSFTATLSAGNNSSFFGRTQAERYPYAAAEATYTSRFGVWGSVVSYNLFATTSFIDETDVSVGWDGDLSKKVDASISYSRFLFGPNSPLVKSSVTNSLDGYVGWDWGYLYSRLNAAYVFGESSDLFLILDNSRYFEIDKVLGGYIALEPRLSATMGTQRFAQTSLVQQQTRGNIPVPPGRGGPRPGPGGTVTTTETTETTRFRLLNTELRVPVTYTKGKVAVQAAWRYAVPLNLLPEDVTRARSFLTASISLTL
ncbi:hypothetical protein LJY25_13360 [Hymenobacter sp. BT175]|uniref:hypothetical protein n=1 Tax=Hymenobacter translucens TaxID=2886507 RepID=UPI001D0EA456|nr:hypothetical protein [Hymenobacter translucens]MCC2547437.1 hypothetical protein [Hymenobacter translucens]